jgi:regulator of sirC expression with transglutaminase-like and TPR domain
MNLAAALRRLDQISRLPDEEIDLGEAALVLAAGQRPSLEPKETLHQLDEWAEELRSSLSPSPSSLEALERLVDFLYLEKGLRGDSETYDDPANSFLDEVIRRRKGIPITLALLLIEVGRRVGVPLEGVSFPGHFLVRHALHPHLVLDPFSRGELLTAEECARLLRRLSQGRVSFSPRLLAPASRREILVRMLRNLRQSYLRRRERPGLVVVLDMMVILDPDDLKARRDRGLLLLERGELERGVADIETYLEDDPDSAEKESLTHVLEAARKELSKVQ